MQENESGKGEGEDYRVSVIDTSTGKKLTGDEAPLKSELEQWLQEHPKLVSPLLSLCVTCRPSHQGCTLYIHNYVTAW